jgi:hypothetical protein
MWRHPKNGHLYRKGRLSAAAVDLTKHTISSLVQSAQQRLSIDCISGHTFVVLKKEWKEVATRRAGPGRKMGKNRVLSSAPVKYWVCGHHRKRHENSIRKAAAQRSVDAPVVVTVDEGVAAVFKNEGTEPMLMYKSAQVQSNFSTKGAATNPKGLVQAVGLLEPGATLELQTKLGEEYHMISAQKAFEAGARAGVGMGVGAHASHAQSKSESASNDNGVTGPAKVGEAEKASGMLSMSGVKLEELEAALNNNTDRTHVLAGAAADEVGASGPSGPKQWPKPNVIYRWRARLQSETGTENVIFGNTDAVGAGGGASATLAQQHHLHRVEL